MLIENQLVQITISNNSKYYRNLGYNVKQGDQIMVPVEHLSPSSHTRVQVQCDICGAIINREYRRYLTEHTYNLDVCKKCVSHKNILVMQERYGVDSPLQNADILERVKQTNLLKYGFESPMQNPQIKLKTATTNMKKYGVKSPFESSEVQEKIAETNLRKYGTVSPSQSFIIKEKVKQTCLERYGVEFVSQVKEFKEKALGTLAQNGNVPTSSQQLKLYNMIKQKYSDAELNYPVGTCLLDVFININDIKIDCEYDSLYFHQDKQKDIRRDKFLQSRGFKTLRIRSGHLLPTEEDLFNAIDCLVGTDRRFIEIILSDWREEEEAECQEQLQVVQ